MNIKKIVTILSFILVVAFVAGCTSLTGLNDVSSNLPQTGNLVLSIVDAPANTYKEVHVNILKVFLKPVGGGEWVQVGDYTSEPYGINLLDLRINELVLPSSDVPVGDYEEIWLVLDKSGYFVYNDDPLTPYPLVVGEIEEEEDDEEDGILGSDEQAIEIEYLFTITEEAITEILIDFDLTELIEQDKETGEYFLNTEAVSAMDKAEAGEIEGKVIAADSTVDYNPFVDILVTVKLYPVYQEQDQNSVPVASTWALWEEMDDEEEEDKIAEPGKFKLRGIPAGTYKLEISAPGYNTVTINNLVIENGEEIEIGDDEEVNQNYEISGGTINEEGYIVLEKVI
ncbi:hypothetical protein BBF96_03915 [Anoxybacter fermentans]|uniref:DUF4382 domain-containing protein n=1 Tax=Anoxybacter fermentans TaxID=1323375 RepID=A0A3S9SWA2_9FIRM|nr:DUF4382 domain-containing protein [Anoxybacter fermentans]AZR72607.1 hypothetical protein BBF96_03915 [Anoxybacter fermentans]